MSSGVNIKVSKFKTTVVTLPLATVFSVNAAEYNFKRRLTYGSYTYSVCNHGTSICSSEVTVSL